MGNKKVFALQTLKRGNCEIRKYGVSLKITLRPQKKLQIEIFENQMLLKMCDMVFKTKAQRPLFHGINSGDV